jgi:uncharacterized repeat protein (TIGR02543 family)
MIPALLVLVALLTLAACDNTPGEDEVTLTFNANGGEPAPKAQSLGSGAKAEKPAAMTKEGYVFGGWYKDAVFTTAWDFALDTVSGDTTLYARWNSTSLVNTVWAGETPRPGDWLTISFKNLATAIAGSEETGLRAIGSFNVDNSTNNWGYTYDDTTRTGTIISSRWNPAPEGFTIDDEGTTLTIKNYGNHGDREFKRLRDKEGTVTIEPEPIAAPSHLAGSVWAGETPRTGDWLTISFKNLETAIKGSEETGERVI